MIAEETDGLADQAQTLFETLLKVASASPRQRIPRREDRGPAPLSSVQQGIWLTYQLNADDTAYNVARAFRLRGALDQDALEKSVNDIVGRHEALRTRFVIQEGQPMQVVQPALRVNLPLVDMRTDPEEVSTADDQPVRDFIIEQSRIPFNLNLGPLLRLSLMRLGEEDHLLLLVIHHIVIDVWSIELFKEELAALYESHAAETAARLPDVPIQYADYAVWQRAWLAEEKHERELAYWLGQLEEYPSTSTLPADRPRPAVQVSRGRRLFLTIPDDLAVALRKLSWQEGATLFMVLLAAFKTLLYRYGGQSDLLVGSPVAGRYQLDSKRVMGCFLNTLILRSDLSGNPSFRDLLCRVRSMALEAYANQRLPFEQLVKALRPERSLSHAPIFQVMFNHIDFTRPTPPAAGLEIEELPVDRGGTLFDMFVETIDDGESLSWAISYNLDLYDTTTIQQLSRHFLTLLRAIVADPDQPIDDIALLSPAERKLLLETWNDTDADYGNLPGIINQFYERVANQPEVVAYIQGEDRLTFAELNRRSNQLAHYLLSQGIKTKTRIGLALDRSLLMPAAILAILKTGSVYLPLDPSFPKERLRFMIEDSAAELILTSSSRRSAIEALVGQMEQRPQILCLDRGDDELWKQPATDIKTLSDSGRIATIIYTSGSTGRPKGVVISELQILNRLAWMWRTYPILTHEAGCQKTSLNFIDSLWELFGYLLQGTPTVIIPDEIVQDPKSLVDTLARHGVTRLWLVPSLLRVILQTQAELQERLPELTFWVCSGEPLPGDLASQFAEAMPHATLHNPYGTTEVWCATWYDLDREGSLGRGAIVPVGRPIGNMRVYVLDAAMNLAPPGAPGELWASGAGLAPGYDGRAEETAERFLPNPFLDEAGGGNLHARVYRTGDLVRWLPDGNIAYFGRADRQIKIRGLRIEPGEIEAQLRRQEGVSDAVVVAAGEGEGKRLIAYVLADGDEEPKPESLRATLADWLTAAMIPWPIVALETFPLTGSGKVDRRALASRETADVHVTGEYSAPRTEREEWLAAIWAELLELERVGIHDNFFDLGGHSLLSIHLFARIEAQFGQRLPINTLFRAPTIAQLADLLDRQGGKGWDVLVPIQSGGSKPPFFCVHGFSGSVMLYKDLARLLGSEQPFYGFQARGINGQEQHLETIEAMAEHYVEAMRAVQPSGPYRIGGFCFGGVVAYEIARQLDAAGESSALVAIFEGHAPERFQRRLPMIHPRRLLTLWRSAPYWWEDYGRRGRVRLRRSAHVKARRLTKRLQRRLGFERGEDVASLIGRDLTDLPSYHQQMMIANFQALSRYNPGVYRGKVVLFRTRSQSASKTLFGALDPAYGWSQLARDGVEVRTIPGAHRNIHQMPHVSSLAMELANCLDLFG